VSATPFWMFKGFLTEGGIRSPLIIARPGKDDANALNTEAVLHVKDMAPTLLDLAGIEPPKTFDGHDVLPMQGVSWAPMMAGQVASPRGADDVLGFEFWGVRAVRKGPWKLVWVHEPIGDADWQLFDLDRDPGETQDLADAHPEIVTALIAEWERYAAENGVILPNRHQFEGMKEQLPPRPMVAADWPPGSEENYGEPEDDEVFPCSYKDK